MKRLKKLFISFLLVLSFAFSFSLVSCQKENNDTITGTYTFQSYLKYNGESFDITNVGNPHQNEGQIVPGETLRIFIFNEDYTGVFDVAGYGIPFTWQKLPNGNITITIDDDSTTLFHYENLLILIIEDTLWVFNKS